MILELHDSWKPYLQSEFNKPYFKNLSNFITTEYKNKTCFPPKNQIFNAFNYCHFEDVKVVIIGQDPYHGLGQAHGLSFSVNDTVKHPPSLVNIFKEIETDIGKAYPKTGNLKHWANQGVLLLNATLTVRAHQAGSHQKKVGKILPIMSLNSLTITRQVLFFCYGVVLLSKKENL